MMRGSRPQWFILVVSLHVREVDTFSYILCSQPVTVRLEHSRRPTRRVEALGYHLGIYEWLLVALPV